VKVLAIVHEDDAGPGVFAQAAAQRGVELQPWRIAAGEGCPGDPFAYDGVVTFGGAMDADEEPENPWLTGEHAMLAALSSAGHPVLGVCLGAQIMARATGGAIDRMAAAEIGFYGVRVSEEGSTDRLFGPLAAGFDALQWHHCEITPPRSATRLAASDRCLQAYRVGERGWGIQFHAEVTLTDFEAWIEHHLARPDADDGEIDLAALRARVQRDIAGWNDFGRGLFHRFLDEVATRS
jgi:GMP synthase-like glutamine amidotransferase